MPHHRRAGDLPPGIRTRARCSIFGASGARTNCAKSCVSPWILCLLLLRKGEVNSHLCCLLAARSLRTADAPRARTVASDKDQKAPSCRSRAGTCPWPRDLQARPTGRELRVRPTDERPRTRHHAEPKLTDPRHSVLLHTRLLVVSFWDSVENIRGTGPSCPGGVHRPGGRRGPVSARAYETRVSPVHASDALHQGSTAAPTTTSVAATRSAVAPSFRQLRYAAQRRAEGGEPATAGRRRHGRRAAAHTARRTAPCSATRRGCRDARSATEVFPADPSAGAPAQYYGQRLP